MLRTRKKTLAAIGGGWSHPYRTGRFDPFLYADGGAGGGSGSGGEGGGEGGAGGGSGEGGAEEDKLGEGGKKALQAERDARATAETRVKELEAKLSRKPKDDGAGAKPDGGKGDQVPDTETLKKELREELTAESNARLIRAEVKAAAAGILADPTDAPKFIDLTKIKVGDDGEPDAKAIKKALADLLKDKPYLAGRQQAWGDVGGGGHETVPTDVEPGMARLRHAYATEKKSK